MTEEPAEAVAPLDAYVTAKPDEPTFTLQGGDPLAAPLVRLWALLARRRVSATRIEQEMFAEVIEAAIGHRVDQDERERENLLIRATAAEEVSWAMDAYVKGDHNADVPTAAEDTHINELRRLELHDMRVRFAGRLSNLCAETTEMVEALKQAEFDPETVAGLESVARLTKELREQVEPRRIFKGHSNA